MRPGRPVHSSSGVNSLYGPRSWARRGWLRGPTEAGPASLFSGRSARAGLVAVSWAHRGGEGRGGGRWQTRPRLGQGRLRRGPCPDARCTRHRPRHADPRHAPPVSRFLCAARRGARICVGRTVSDEPARGTRQSSPHRQALVGRAHAAIARRTPQPRAAQSPTSRAPVLLARPRQSPVPRPAPGMPLDTSPRPSPWATPQPTSRPASAVRRR